MRQLQTKTLTFSLPSMNFSYFADYKLRPHKIAPINVPEMAFSEIKEPQVKKGSTKAPLKIEKVAKIQLNFSETIKTSPVFMHETLPQNLAALFVELKAELVAEVKPVQDEVTMTFSSSSEPEFFDYTKKEIAANRPSAENLPKDDSAKLQIETSDEINSNAIQAEEVAVEELMSFDYSKASADAKSQNLPSVTKVTTQPVKESLGVKKAHQTKWDLKSNSSPKKKMPTNQEATPLVAEKTKSSSLTTQPGPLYQNRVSIQLIGTNLDQNWEEVGFEVRFQDDHNDSFNDYNNGGVTIDHDLSSPRMTRSMVVLKRGFIPTNTDLILEEGVTEVVVPSIEESTFNDIMAPFGQRGPIGAVLVELDKSTMGATLDVPYSQLLRLDEDLKVTDEKNYSYELFLGVQAGNAMLSYKTKAGKVISKIVHVHEHELTFETNFFEPSQSDVFSLYEEDLLSREKTPLVISSQEVKQFATDKKAIKLNNHTYKLDFLTTLLGARKYLELTHQEEALFVGYKDQESLLVPSENFMRYLLSRFEGGKLGSRCMIQVNLKKKALSYEVSAESVGQSLATYTQVLDADGKFYDSVGSKSRKIIIVGENQGPSNLNPDSKVNIKISYTDGSVDFLGTYCSPNTYLVEQL